MFRMMRVQSGFSLVEALVALVVLSIGMLGIAGMYVESVRNGRVALTRTQAVNLVSDMADRIRANANAGASYATATYASAPAQHDCAPTSSSAGGNCGIADLAEDDLARWVAAVRATLPADGAGLPAAEVQYFPAPAPREPDRYRVSIRWKEPTEQKNGAGPNVYSYRTDVVIQPRPPVS
jgi:type IV pilus assembly protein PilV